MSGCFWASTDVIDQTAVREIVYLRNPPSSFEQCLSWTATREAPTELGTCAFIPRLMQFEPASLSNKQLDLTRRQMGEDWFQRDMSTGGATGLQSYQPMELQQWPAALVEATSIAAVAAGCAVRLRGPWTRRLAEAAVDDAYAFVASHPRVCTRTVRHVAAVPRGVGAFAAQGCFEGERCWT